MMMDEAQYAPMPRAQDARQPSRNDPQYRVAAAQDAPMGMPEYETQGLPQRGEYGISSPPARSAYETEPLPPIRLVEVNPGSRERYREYFLSGEGINREVLQMELTSFLGHDATSRPARDTEVRMIITSAWSDTVID